MSRFRILSVANMSFKLHLCSRKHNTHKNFGIYSSDNNDDTVEERK